MYIYINIYIFYVVIAAIDILSSSKIIKNHSVPTGLIPSFFLSQLYNFTMTHNILLFVHLA